MSMGIPLTRKFIKRQVRTDGYLSLDGIRQYPVSLQIDLDAQTACCRLPAELAPEETEMDLEDIEGIPA
jgi:hypothetical protein